MKVDGKEVEVPQDDAGPGHRQAGADDDDPGLRRGEASMVPHYCYHPKLPVAGNCRMCLVEFGTPAIGPGPQADPEPGRHAEDRQVAAPGHRLRHADFAGHGDLHEHARP